MNTLLSPSLKPLPRKPLLRLLMLTLCLPLLFSACDDQRMKTVTWVEYEPVYMSREAFVNSVQMENPRDLENPGKIYFYNGYLFVNERNKGVHIIDNRNPASPFKVGFINIPANKDIAVRDDLLYADSHSDLLVFDIENLDNPRLVARKEGVFEVSATRIPGFPYQPADPSRGIVVDWKRVERERVCQGDCYTYEGGVFYDAMANTSGGTGGAGSAAGVGGSMARFAINGEHLYAVDHENLLTFDISSEVPEQKSRKGVGWAIETIFPYRNSLFIGSESAMYIYDITRPEAPAQLSVYSHLTACDPVVVEGGFAYVTLREGTRCASGVNRLEVIDVSDLTRPKRVDFYEMSNPHGLGIDDGRLFISEGDEGLKIMDASDPFRIKPLHHIKNIKATDVIPYREVLMVTGESGIIQYDYSDIHNVRYLSTIPVHQGS